jgi:hypothetical protein|tara:strand:+ start:384 stop:518 length:135 start_codon:yes stop_codon:yes gene_type:complete
MTPEWDRVFPDDRDMLEIEVDRYILLVRNWGQRLHKKLKRIEEK